MSKAQFLTFSLLPALFFYKEGCQLLPCNTAQTMGWGTQRLCLEGWLDPKNPTLDVEETSKYRKASCEEEEDFARAWTLF